MICSNISVNENNHLTFAGQDTCLLAQKYGTPLYLMDEERIRRNCRVYKEAFARHFKDATPLYASKANCFLRLYQILKEEDMGVDVVSSGEMYTAMKAGFDLGKAYFHSNNKTDADISYGMDCGIGYFVADNEEEIKAIEKEAAKRGIVQKVLLRLSPGIDPHTYEAISTGKIDSKFGVPIETGQADELVSFILENQHINLMGFHCHIGSQVFLEDVFERTTSVMLNYIAHVKEKFGFIASELDIGGGFGVRYTDKDIEFDIDQKISQIAQTFHSTCSVLGLEEPAFHMEPGRSIVADAGMTLYTVGTVKKIPGYKNYVSIDGSMADNPRYALYKASYTCYDASKMDEKCTFKASIVGRCCESGDIIQENILLPQSIGRGDIVAVCTTGAYHYSMASNYNRLPKPATVMLNGTESYVAVNRESFEDLVKNEVLL